jgi:hypothetical protein
VKKLRKMVGSILIFSLLLGLVNIAPTLAKNFNVPEGVNVVYSSSGEGIVMVPAGWPDNAAHPTMLRITAISVADGTLDASDANLEIDIPHGSAWVPMVYFVTGSNPDLVPWAKQLLSGLPCAMLPGNTRALSTDVLKVERHGNTINVELTTPQTVLWYNPTLNGFVQVTLPAFTIQLEKVGGSVHKETTMSLTGWPGASGWTGVTEKMGFNANGVFTSSGWNSEMANCFITMHGIGKWTPP